MASSDQTPVQKAEAWLDDQTVPEGNRPKGLTDVDGQPTVDDLRREQRREIEGATLGTEGQTRGAVFGTIAFGAAGLVIGVIVGVAFFDGDSPGRMVVPVIVTLFAGVMGFVYWGGRTPELENETMGAGGAPGDGSTPRSPDSDDRGR